MARLVQRLVSRVRRRMQGKIEHRSLYLPYTVNKRGLEIGGPSQPFRRGQPLDLYDGVAELDNCDFSASTVWAEQHAEFVFAEGKPPGRTIIRDGSKLDGVGDRTYDFVLSCHNLEHFANPLKALREWERVIHSSGALILVLPHHRYTFDHRRQPTSVEHMLEDFAMGVGEDDLTHLPEILERHDLSMDRAAGTAEQFRERSQQNFANRCLHHHVFDLANSRELLERSGFKVHSVDFAYPFHICVLATPRGPEDRATW